MQVYCTRPGCPRPVNQFADLDDNVTLKTVQQKFCTTCGMPLLLIGRYVPSKLLGKGGFGAAFLARDRYTPAMRQCVVKLFQPSGDLSPDQLQLAQNLFEREGEVLEELGNKHPQIPDLLAFFPLDVPSSVPGKFDRFFYLVQEFIDGQNLEEELQQKGKFSEVELREVLKEILNVLRFVHENGSIHRDIKPSNIMRRRDGRLYLLDFGAVKQVTTAAAQPGRASTGIYSMGYAPPEQMAGSTVYPATDLYALAVTCITLLTGKEPGELYDSYSNGWNWRAYAQVSDRLEAVLNRMLLATPSQRFQSADEVLDALNTAPPSVAAPVPAPAPTPAPTPRPSVAATPNPSTSLQPAARSARPAAQSPASSASRAQPPRPRFSTLAILSDALFTGFEGGVIAIAAFSLLGLTTTALGLCLAWLLGLIVLQALRWVEWKEHIIITGALLAFIVLFAPSHAIVFRLSAGNPIVTVLVLAGLTALVALAIATLFRLIYKLLSSLF